MAQKRRVSGIPHRQRQLCLLKKPTEVVNACARDRCLPLPCSTARYPWHFGLMSVVRDQR